MLNSPGSIVDDEITNYRFRCDECSRNACNVIDGAYLNTAANQKRQMQIAYLNILI